MTYIYSNSWYYRQRAKEEADRVDVPRTRCLQQANAVYGKLMAIRLNILAQFVREERERRNAWNTKFRWLPRCFHYSLDEKVIRDAYPHEVLNIYRINGKVLGAAKKLVDLCEKESASSVSVTRRDWKILQDYLKQG